MFGKNEQKRIEKMMKEVIIVTADLGYGGVEVALVNMLKNIDYNKYKVDLMVMNEKNVYIDEIPKSVSLIVNKYQNLKMQLINNLKKFRILKAIKVMNVYLSKNYMEKNKLFIKSIEKIGNKVYDYAIAYGSDLQVQYIASSVNSKKKIMYLHGQPWAHENDFKTYEKMDLICCVSKGVADKLEKLDEKLVNKTLIVPNAIDVQKIEELAKKGETFEDKYSGMRILTVGRLSSEKGYEMAIKVLRKLIDNQYKVRWYIIGDGYFRKQIEQEIRKNDLEQYCILLGAKKNPYKYMKDCDIYVQPSLAEGYCITTAEAKIFNKPIVRTNTLGAKEQFENGINGIITDISEDGLYDGIVKYMTDKTFRDKVIGNLEKEEKKGMK